MESDEFPSDPLQRVVEGYCDFVTPFEKFEGHPARKAVDGKWRIVTCLSLVDQLCERFFYTDFIRNVKESYPNSGVTIGIGFTDQMAKSFCRLIPKGVYSTDISGMDRSIDATYVNQNVRSCVERLPHGCSKLSRAMYRHNDCMLDPVFALDTYSGRSRLYVGTGPKGMLSGRYVTTFFNSRSRVDMAFLAGATFVRACGDDCLEQHLPGVDLVKVYEGLGFVLRNPQYLNGSLIEFCSHTFRSPEFKPELSSWPKALYKLATRKTTLEQKLAFLYEVRHHPRYVEFKKVIDLLA
jgi:hypothetical protein